jgi:hypothetical protein
VLQAERTTWMLMTKERRPLSRTLSGWAIEMLHEAHAIREHSVSVNLQPDYRRHLMMPKSVSPPWCTDCTKPLAFKANGRFVTESPTLPPTT